MMQGKRRYFLTVPVLVGGLLMAVSAMAPAEAAPPGFCARYASTAVWQNQRNQQLNCGYFGPRWHDVWEVHFSWCLTTSRRKARREIRVRRQLLRQCRRGSGSWMRTFRAPRVGGLRLDWCKYRGWACGAPAANAYCRLRGYRYATRFRIAPNIGRWTDTWIIGSAEICAANYCDGFRYITCVR